MPPPEVLLQPLDRLPDPLAVPHLAQTRGGPASFVARIRPPGSKSLTNRALLLAALASGESKVRRPLTGAEDTERMITALQALGSRIGREDQGPSSVPSAYRECLRVEGVCGRWKLREELRLDLANAGTAVRFLTAAAALSPAPLIIDGNPRMRERPIRDLADALEQLGAAATYLGRDGCPPLRVTPPPVLHQSARIAIDHAASSQFISALLLLAPFLPGGITLSIHGPLTSRSYIQMTLGLLDALGVRVRTSDDLRIIRVSGGGLKAFDYTIEPDASSATYFWGAAAICPGSTARILGLDSRSLQGDAAFPELLSRMGAVVLRDDGSREDGAEPWVGVRGPARLDPVMADMSQMPDAALTLACVACFARGRSVLRGLKTLRIKESDRIAALHAELTKIGVRVEIGILGDPDSITIQPPERGLDCSPSCPTVEFETYDDHRMAMALSLVALKRPNTLIRDPGCVAKTYPTFWRDLAELY